MITKNSLKIECLLNAIQDKVLRHTVNQPYYADTWLRLSYITDVPFTLMFVNNTPRIEGSHVTISFRASKPVYSATCYLGRSLRENCTTGSVEFTNVKSASYVFRVVALDKERFGHKIIERRLIHVLGKPSSRK